MTKTNENTVEQGSNTEKQAPLEIYRHVVMMAKIKATHYCAPLLSPVCLRSLKLNILMITFLK